VLASMGPGFVHPGNQIGPDRRDRIGRASMGPGFVHPGNPDPRSSDPEQVASGFNGARVCTPGKCGWTTPTCGNGRGFNGARVCTPGKYLPLQRAARTDSRFNGARVCTPGKCPSRTAGPSSARELQWGPGLYTREIVTTFGRSASPPLASMGPGFVHPGNLLEAHLPGPVRQLQWGPGLYTREMTLKLRKCEA